ncbi:tail completion protein gp17 [Allopusillimonas ginsengisoli]|uniref:tail completion protein gp17 n=1 Tax=Allopusillimonas ginsengisoli TaxID=453575 RepID=UPI00102231FA|nr:DUF3168 domain-containing protein [Allopusillimonas ginsengisoli]TEA79835.1 DUF3168 domain-containing protein [Allopusillimonas ginsengisoli]
MSFESDLRACLLPLVTSGVYFGVLPLDKVPTAESPSRAGWSAIVLPTEIVTPDNTICGASDLEDYRVQIDAYAPSYGQLVTLRTQIFSAVEATFESAARINDLTDYDPDLKLHRRIIEYSISAE